MNQSKNHRRNKHNDRTLRHRRRTAIKNRDSTFPPRSPPKTKVTSHQKVSPETVIPFDTTRPFPIIRTKRKITEQFKIPSKDTCSLSFLLFLPPLKNPVPSPDRMFIPQSPYGNWNCKHKKFCKYLKRDGKDVIEPFYHAGKLSGYRIDVACGNQNLSAAL